MKVENKVICLACHRHCFGLDVDLGPPDRPEAMEKCDFCERPTNAGLYVDVEEVKRANVAG